MRAADLETSEFSNMCGKMQIKNATKQRRREKNHPKSRLSTLVTFREDVLQCLSEPQVSAVASCAQELPAFFKTCICDFILKRLLLGASMMTQQASPLPVVLASHLVSQQLHFRPNALLIDW